MANMLKTPSISFPVPAYFHGGLKNREKRWKTARFRVHHKAKMHLFSVVVTAKVKRKKKPLQQARVIFYTREVKLILLDKS